MIPRRNDLARGVAVCLASLVGLAPATTLAQDEKTAPSATEPSKDAKDAEKKEEPKAEEPSSSETESSGAKSEASVEVKAEANAAAPAPAPAEKGDADDPERKRAVAFVGIEHVPPSAYPEPKVRGITGGSLAMTMHGLQWPYLNALDGNPGVRIGISGSAWVDTSYRKVDAGLHPADPDLEQWLQQSRFVLRTTPTYNAENNWFVQGQAELVANGDQTNPEPTEIVDTDDLYVRAGKWDVFDVTAGRFQGWEIYHFGMGLDLNTFERQGAVSQQNVPPGIYGVTHFWDRPNGSGNIAAHIYPIDIVRVELLGQLGNVGGFNSLAFRGVGILDIGILKLKVGYEAGEQTRQEQAPGYPDKRHRDGYGAAAQVVVFPHFEAGLNYAKGFVDVTNNMGGIDNNLSVRPESFGGFANARVIDRLVVGGGVNYTKETNLATDENSQLLAFGAVQYSFWWQLYIKAVFAYADADFNPLSDQMPIEFHNKAYSARLRFMYLF